MMELDEQQRRVEIREKGREFDGMEYFTHLCNFNMVLRCGLTQASQVRILIPAVRK